MGSMHWKKGAYPSRATKLRLLFRGVAAETHTYTKTKNKKMTECLRECGSDLAIMFLVSEGRNVLDPKEQYQENALVNDTPQRQCQKASGITTLQLFVLNSVRFEAFRGFFCLCVQISIYILPCIVVGWFLRRRWTSNSKEKIFATTTKYRKNSLLRS